MREVRIDAVSLNRLARLLDAERAERLNSNVALARRILDGRVVWNVNATASGGGVAEMLTTLLAYTRGAGVDARWLVLDGNPTFFRITKRLHNFLHGSPGDGGSLGDAERVEYESVLAGNLDAMRSLVRAGDIVLLHDPQAAAQGQGRACVIQALHPRDRRRPLGPALHFAQNGKHHVRRSVDLCRDAELHSSPPGPCSRSRSECV